MNIVLLVRKIVITVDLYYCDLDEKNNSGHIHEFRNQNVDIRIANNYKITSSKSALITLSLKYEKILKLSSGFLFSTIYHMTLTHTYLNNVLNK